MALKLNGGSIYAAVNDGSTETTSLLYDSSLMTWQYEGVIRHRPSEGVIKFVLDNIRNDTLRDQDLE